MIGLHAAIVALALGGGPQPVLLDFGADWCGPCQQMQPIIRQMKAAGYPVKEVNLDRDRELAEQYDVSKIPCFVLVAGDEEVDRVVGSTTAARLVQMFDKYHGRLPAPPPPPPGIGMPAMRSATPLAMQQSGPQAKGRPQLPPAQLPPEVVARCMAASVRLKIADGDGHSVGSGTIIDARNGDALVLTCGHVFRDSKGEGKITVELFSGGTPTPVSGRLLSYDLKADLGLVIVRPPHAVVAVNVAPAGAPIRSGDAVVSVGCDQGADPSPRVSRVTTVDKFLGPSNVEVAGQPVQGRSGGGLFNAQGQLIGVCNAADPSDDEGLFAALSTVHAELVRMKLDRVLATAASPAANAVAANPSMPDRMPNVIPGRTRGNPTSLAESRGPLTAPEQAILGAAADTPGAEVVCILRSLDDPRAKSQVIVIDRASPAFLEQLAADRQRQESRRLTSFEASKKQPQAQVATATPKERPQGESWQPKWRTVNKAEATITR